LPYNHRRKLFELTRRRFPSSIPLAARFPPLKRKKEPDGAYLKRLERLIAGKGVV
jgi:hypothetical protein